MKNKNLVLLRTLLDSTSLWNSYKYCKDKKKKGRIIGNMMGMAVLYVLMMVYCIGTCIGYGKMGMTDIIPATCALTISIIAAFFTFLKTNGYLLKTITTDELFTAIHDVYGGIDYIQPDLLPYLNNYLINKDIDREKINLLTARELELLKMIASGKKNLEIATTLNISERTVKNHLSHVFDKLKVADRTQAAVFAIRNNLN